MKTLIKILGFIGLAGVIVVAIGLITNFGENQKAEASIVEGQAYHATTTTTTLFASTTKRLKLGAGTLGSIIVTSTSTSPLTIYNAASSTDSGSSTFAIISAAIPFGTYTFDAEFNRGLVISATTTFNGSYVITWR